MLRPWSTCAATAGFFGIASGESADVKELKLGKMRHWGSAALVPQNLARTVAALGVDAAGKFSGPGDAE